jgi:hypothetical protein
MIENGWQENIHFKSYSMLYYTVRDTSLLYAVTYNTLQVVVYPTNDFYLGILRLRWGGGGDAHNISVALDSRP